MAQNLKIKGCKVTLSGDELTGDTYPIKGYIKEYLCGKWNPERKSWTVDLGQVEQFMTAKYPSIVIDNDPAPVAKANGSARWNGWCNKCHSYCWGDCEANS